MMKKGIKHQSTATNGWNIGLTFIQRASLWYIFSEAKKSGKIFRA